MTEIKGPIAGPNLTLTPRERALVNWLTLAEKKLGNVDMVIKEMRIGRDGRITADVDVGIRAMSYPAWKSQADKFCAADIVTSSFVIDASTGELRGVLCVRVRVDV